MSEDAFFRPVLGNCTFPNLLQEENTIFHIKIMGIDFPLKSWSRNKVLQQKHE